MDYKKRMLDEISLTMLRLAEAGRKRNFDKIKEEMDKLMVQIEFAEAVTGEKVHTNLENGDAWFHFE